MGNGGWIFDASYVVVEFVHPVTAGRPVLAAPNPGAGLAVISAVGNDFGFWHIFIRQLLAHARKGDALIGISTRGAVRKAWYRYCRGRRKWALAPSGSLAVRATE